MNDYRYDVNDGEEEIDFDIDKRIIVIVRHDEDGNEKVFCKPIADPLFKGRFFGGERNTKDAVNDYIERYTDPTMSVTWLTNSITNKTRGRVANIVTEDGEQYSLQILYIPRNRYNNSQTYDWCLKYWDRKFYDIEQDWNFIGPVPAKRVIVNTMERDELIFSTAMKSWFLLLLTVVFSFIIAAAVNSMKKDD